MEDPFRDRVTTRPPAVAYLLPVQVPRKQMQQANHLLHFSLPQRPPPAPTLSGLPRRPAPPSRSKAVFVAATYRVVLSDWRRQEAEAAGLRTNASWDEPQDPDQEPAWDQVEQLTLAGPELPACARHYCPSAAHPTQVPCAWTRRRLQRSPAAATYSARCASVVTYARVTIYITWTSLHPSLMFQMAAACGNVRYAPHRSSSALFGPCCYYRYHVCHCTAISCSRPLGHEEGSIAQLVLLRRAKGVLVQVG